MTTRPYDILCPRSHLEPFFFLSNCRRLFLSFLCYLHCPHHFDFVSTLICEQLTLGVVNPLLSDRWQDSN